MKNEIDLKENIIKGELADKINKFEKAHPEIDLGWFNDLIGDIITMTIEIAEKKLTNRGRLE